MVPFDSISQPQLSRRRFLKAGLGTVAAMALYSSEIERHWVEITSHEVALQGLPAAFDGFRVVHLSDIHMDEFTEPFFLRQVVEQINRLRPDAVVLTGDYVSYGIGSNHYAIGAAWQCAEILKTLQCKQIFASLGNHDVAISSREVTRAFSANGITILNNSCLPMQRAGGRFWLAGVDDPVYGRPKLALAIPASIRNLPNEPVVLLCHAPDYADQLLRHPAGSSVGLMLSGHTHGGQVRLPLIGALLTNSLGRKYVQGWFRLGGLQLYVNRGLGTSGLPFRLDCRPEIALLTLRRASMASS